jgi:hypothetical protein
VDPPDSKTLADIRLGVNEDGILSLESSLSVSISSLDDVSNIVFTERGGDDLISRDVVGVQVLSWESGPLSSSYLVVIVSINVPVTSRTNGISHRVIKSSPPLSVKTMLLTSSRLLMLTDRELSRLRMPSSLTPSLMSARVLLSGGSTTVRLDQVYHQRVPTRPSIFQKASQLVSLLMMVPTPTLEPVMLLQLPLHSE